MNITKKNLPALIVFFMLVLEGCLFIALISSSPLTQIYTATANTTGGFFNNTVATAQGIHLIRNSSTTFNVTSITSPSGNYRSLIYYSASATNWNISFGTNIIDITNETVTNENANVTLQFRTASDYNISDSSLVAFWSFNADNVSGAIETVYDELKLNNGTRAGEIEDALESKGIIGKGYNFDGVNDYLSFNDHDRLSFGNGSTDMPFTFSAWINIKGNGGGGGGATNAILSKGNYSGSMAEYIFYVSNSNNLSLIRYVGLPSASATEQYLTVTNYTINRSIWNFVTATWNGSTTLLYINGVNVPSRDTKGATYTGMQNTVSNVTIGSVWPSDSSWKGLFNGLIDEVRIYNRSLDASEVLDLYDMGATQFNDWSAYDSEQPVTSDVSLNSSTSNKFMQFKLNFYSNQSENSPRMIYSLSNPLTECGDLNVPNMIYTLGANVFSKKTCFNIYDSNITLDCAGYSINYSSGIPTTSGINITNTGKYFTNITIKNCIIQKNNFTTGGSSYGIYAVNLINSFIYNNTIQSSGTTLDHGIYMPGNSSYVTFDSNNITTFGTGVNNVGIYLAGNVTNINITHNYIYTNGTTTNYGIYIFSNLDSSNNHLIDNNEIWTRGTTTNYGIYLVAQTNSSDITNNTINTNGTTNNYGIYTMNSFENSRIKNNVIRTGAGATSYGIYMLNNSNYNVISNNNISTRYASSEYGIAVLANFSYNVIDSNNITTCGNVNNNVGIYLSVNVTNNNITNNYIYANGTTTTNYGIQILGTLNYTSTNNLIENNVIWTKGTTTTNYGIYVNLNSNRTIIKNNNITTQGTNNNHGVYILGTTGIICRDNIIEHNNITLNTSGTTNVGVYLSVNTTNNTVTNNFINTRGSQINHGIDIDQGINAVAEDNYIEGNVVFLQISADTNHGVVIGTNANRNIVRSNNISINGGTGANYGVNLLGAATTGMCRNNIVDNNNITHQGTTTASAGVYITTNVTNNTITNNFIKIFGGTTANYGVWLVGIANTSSNDNYINNNVIFTNGTTTNYGIYINLNTNVTHIKNNNITTQGTNSNYGVYILGAVTGICRDNIIDNNNITTQARGTTNIGIVSWANVTHNNITNNFIDTNGTQYNYGIDLGSAVNAPAENNTINNNVIFAKGTSDSNIGIYFTINVNNNNITNNTIFTNGTTLNYGIYVLGTNAECNYNYIYNNNISAYGALTGSEYGIYIFKNSSDNEIVNNDIIASGRTDNRGIVLQGIAPEGNVDRNIVHSNRILATNNGTTGTGAVFADSTNHGIYIYLESSNNTIANNNITVVGSDSSWGIMLQGATTGKVNYNQISNNTVSLNTMAGSNRGIVAYLNVSNNIMENNILYMNGTDSNVGMAAWATAGSLAANNTIKNNIIALNTTTTNNYGVYLTLNADNNTVTNNIISTRGTTPNYGIYLFGGTGTTVYNNYVFNNSITTGQYGVSNHGIYLNTNTSYNNISYNTIFSNGTNTNYGINIAGAANAPADFNVVNGNVITVEFNRSYTLASGTANRGISVGTYTSSNNITNNNMTVYGTLTNYGIYLVGTTARDSRDNIIDNNQIDLQTSVSGNFGVYLNTQVDSNIITRNNISINSTSGAMGIRIEGTTTSIANKNFVADNIINILGWNGTQYGIYSTLASGNYFYRNNITLKGTNANYGINVVGTTSPSNDYVMQDNNISVIGTTAGNIGIYLLTNVHDNLIKGNYVYVNGSTGTIGMGFSASSKNIISDNMVFVTGNMSNTSLGFYFVGASTNEELINNTLGYIDGSAVKLSFVTNTPNDITLRENTFIGANNFDFLTDFMDISGISFINQRINKYNFTSFGSRRVTIENTSAGKVYYPVYINTSNATLAGNFSDSIVISSNSIYINETIIGINRTANLSFYGISQYQHPTAYRNGLECITPVCININYAGNNTYTFMVPGGGLYQIFEVDVSANLSYPANNSYFSEINSTSLNYTVYHQDSDNGNVTVWLYGNENLLNTSNYATNNTNLSYTWNNLAVGVHNWSVIINDEENINFTTPLNYFTIFNFTLKCEAGGNYSASSLVLIQGNASNGIDWLINQTLNITLYNSSSPVQYKILNSSLMGDYYTGFSGLANDNYTLNVSSTYRGVYKECIDFFSVGAAGGAGLSAPASLNLDKIISLHELTSANITYNITLRTTNKGGSTASSLNITDADYGSFNLGSLASGDTNLQSYLKTYTRNSSNYNVSLAIAAVNGTDNSNGTEISANSTQIVIVIPATTANTSLTLTKNAEFLDENTTSVSYNISISIINSGGNDLSAIAVNDTDLALNTEINLNRTQNYSASGTIIIQKLAESREYNFTKANATHNSIVYQSNLISVLIPKFESNASLVLSKAASLYSTNNTAITYNITLSLTNSGARNATNAYIIDSDSTGSPYNIGVMTAGQTNSTSYLLTFTRQASISDQTLSIATANATDSLNGLLISSNSSEIKIVIPALTTSTPASLVLDKIISMQELTSANITYNITLRTTNKGGSTASSLNITDADYGSFNLGSLASGNTNLQSYLKTYTRNSTNYNVTLAIANVNGTDDSAGTEITANSTRIFIVIPATTANTSLTLTKNAEFLDENTTSVSYNISVEVVNSGGIDLGGIAVNDSDISLNVELTLNRTLSYSNSTSVIIQKTAESREYNFTKANATHNSIVYQSNLISVLIPKFESNASLVLSKAASLYSTNNTAITYNITLSLTNSGARNATNAYITDSNSTDSPYNVGTLIAGQSSSSISYLQTFTREASITNRTLSIATANATDSLNGVLISANSSEISVVIPALSELTSASLALDKIISLHELTSANITYNITLRTTNKGGSNVSSINLTDADSGSFNLGTLTAGSSDYQNYLKTYTRNSTNYNVTLAIANVNGTDDSAGTEISANSTQIVIVIPATTANTSLTLTKNAEFLDENTTSVSYNISVEVVNSGGIDLGGVKINDSDIALNIEITLNRTLSYSNSSTVIITKTAESREYNFTKANATHNEVVYQSNQLSVLIPKFESNASFVLSKAASLYSTNNTAITYNITLSLTNSGARNATNAYITDSNSTDSPYNVGTLIAGQSSSSISYLQTFTREASITNRTLSIATANATDSLNGVLISANSSEISVSIPPITVGSASFVLDKIASFYNITNETIFYNITLRLTNKGSGNAESINITDLNYEHINFTIGTLNYGEYVLRSYLINFTRNSTTYSNSTLIARAYGIDSYTGNYISANSSSINLTVPSTESGQQLTVIKSAAYASQTNTSVNYTLTVQIVNSGGVDLTSITVLDLTDLGLSATINLNRTQAYNYSGEVKVSKAQSNSEHDFSIASATVNLITYNSTQLKILIPGYGNGPTDLSISAPASVSASTSFDSTITIVNQNPDIGQDFTIDYWITSNDNLTNYSSGSKTIYVAANGGSNTTAVSLTAPSSAGTYILMSKIRESLKDASDSFEVTSAAPTPDTPAAGGGGGSVTAKAVEEVVCNPPYIRFEKGCCLDASNNSICDKDEILEAPEEKNETKATEEIISKGPGFLSMLLTKIKEAGRIFADYLYQNKLYALLALTIVAAVLILRFVIVQLSRAKSKNQMEQNIGGVLKLVAEGRIKEAKSGYQNIKKIYNPAEEIGNKKYREIIEICKNILKNKLLMTPIEIIAGIIILFFFLKSNFARNVIYPYLANARNLMKAIAVLLAIAIAVIAVIIFKNKKPKEITRLGHLKGIEVYSENGYYIGRVNDVIIEESKIKSLKINLDKRYELNLKGILLNYKHVKTIGKIILVDEAIFSRLGEYFNSSGAKPQSSQLNLKGGKNEHKSAD